MKGSVSKAVAWLASVILCGALWGCREEPDAAGTPARPDAPAASKEGGDDVYQVTKSDAEWREQLTPEQYRITREACTEPAFTGKYYRFKGKGIYRCVGCAAELFRSEAKYDSGSGWPSFWQPAAKDNIEEAEDTSLGMTRTEVRCSRCGAHLGHLFDDGPEPTGLRYCINSAALQFDEQKGEVEAEGAK